MKKSVLELVLSRTVEKDRKESDGADGAKRETRQEAETETKREAPTKMNPTQHKHDTSFSLAVFGGDPFSRGRASLIPLRPPAQVPTSGTCLFFYCITCLLCTTIQNGMDQTGVLVLQFPERFPSSARRSCLGATRP